MRQTGRIWPGPPSDGVDLSSLDQTGSFQNLRIFPLIFLYFPFQNLEFAFHDWFKLILYFCCIFAMELYLFRQDEWAKLYNCSRVNIDDVPLEERRQTINGIVMLILFFIFEILYIPCLAAIWKHRAQSCYKFLFFIGVIDVLMLPFQGLVSAVYSLFGVVFCTFPAFNYLTGLFACAFFASQTSANLFLALDRLVDTISPKHAKILFSNWRPWLWTTASSLFGLYYCVVVKAPVFSPTFGNWFFNPYQDYVNISVDQSDYVHPIIMYYDALLSFGFPIIYALFVLFFLRKYTRMNGTKMPPTVVMMKMGPTGAADVGNNPQHHFQKAQPNGGGGGNNNTNYVKILFVQVAAINGINVATFVLYAIMQHLPMCKLLTVVAFYCNYLMFGLPPIIYLLVNRTIRNECRKIVKDFIKCCI